MLTKASTFCLFIFILASISNVSAQSIVPSTFNMGGGSYDKGSFHFDWSIGDGVSIETFQSNRNLIVTSGVLQPFTENAGIPDFSTHPWAKDELAVFPIPTHNILNVDLKIAETGLITMQVINQRGQLILMNRFDFDGTNNKQKIDLTRLTPGIYYLNVIMGGVPEYPMIRKGSFKIQKL